MNRRTVSRRVAALHAREARLCDRFLEPKVAPWDPESLDRASAYVALLHAEVEATLEAAVSAALTHGRACTASGRPHPGLVNCVMYYRAEASSRLGVSLTPGRKRLERDPAELLKAWDELGAREYFEAAVVKNHGAGIDYVERLLHPIGVVVSGTRFSSQAESRGVRALATLHGKPVEMQEFVTLRGRAVHASAAEFKLSTATTDSSQLRRQGRAAVEFAAETVRLLGRVLT